MADEPVVTDLTESKAPEKTADELVFDKKLEDAVTKKELELRRESDDRAAEREEAIRKDTAQREEQMLRYAQQFQQTTAQPVVEEANPHDPEQDPTQWAVWQSEANTKRAIDELTKTTLQPIAEKLVSEIRDVRELGSTYTREKITGDPFYKRFEKEVEDTIKQLPEDKRRDPRVMENALHYVKGKHMEDIIKEEREKATNAPEPVSTIAPAAPRAPARVTPKIKQMAEAFGMEPEEYAKSLADQGVDTGSLDG